MPIEKSCPHLHKTAFSMLKFPTYSSGTPNLFMPVGFLCLANSDIKETSVLRGALFTVWVRKLPCGTEGSVIFPVSQDVHLERIIQSQNDIFSLSCQAGWRVFHSLSACVISLLCCSIKALLKFCVATREVVQNKPRLHFFQNPFELSKLGCAPGSYPQDANLSNWLLISS